ncbi:hypothetical protein Dsin_026385 [Dipteronia sinensis]|uniref:Phytocyanin domain-containing protein n=1 Tax=Dipteronia sinensis TaxID=43782 RepID=A0AAE0DXR4_9ROSI|nr:hypothetical protein Dsin_026385 [Dipteronia sinensis]
MSDILLHDHQHLSQLPHFLCSLASDLLISTRFLTSSTSDLPLQLQGLHSVVELESESAYKSCDLGTALDSMNTGKDVVKLDKSGTRYFAYGTLGHCESVTRE